MEYILRTTEEFSKEVASRLKAIRKLKKITQKEMSIRSNVSLSSIKRWEEDGEISFISFIKIVKTLGVEGEIDNLFRNNYYKNIEEVIRDNK